MIKFINKWVIFVLLILLVGSQSYAITLGELINPTEEFLECNDLQWPESVICEMVSKEVNSRLNDLNLSNGSIIYTMAPVPGLEASNYYLPG